MPFADGNDGRFFMVYTNRGKGKLGTQLSTFGLAVSVGTVTVTTT
jgi:hypothetical protein